LGSQLFVFITPMFYAPPLIHQAHRQCNLYEKKWCIKHSFVEDIIIPINLFPLQAVWSPLPAGSSGKPRINEKDYMWMYQN